MPRPKNTILTPEEWLEVIRDNNLPGRTSWTCTSCGTKDLSIDEFGTNGKSGRRGNCKKCRNGNRPSSGKGVCEFNRFNPRPLDNYNCKQCKREGLTREDFCYVTRGKKRLTYCKDCTRMNQYDLPYDDHLQLQEISEKYGCFICQGPPTTWVSGRRGGLRKGYCIDHCHDTETVRGLTCKECNIAMGHIKDNPELLRAAADYIERARQSDFHPVRSMKKFIEEQNQPRYMPVIPDFDATAYYQAVR